MNSKLSVEVKFLNTSKGTIVMNNLINDGGLDMLASTYCANVFKYAQMGTGTRQNARDSGTMSLSQSGTTVTADLGFFVAADASNGRKLQFEDGTWATISAFVTDVQVTVVESQTVLAQPAILYSIEETALETPTEASGTYVSGFNGSFSSQRGQFEYIVDVGDQRTFDFGVASGDTTRTEFGWGPTLGIGNAVFGRLVTDITWLDGASMEVNVTFKRAIDCNIETIGALPITGATHAATSRLMFGDSSILFGPLRDPKYLSTVASDGTTVIGANISGSLLEMFLTAGPGLKISVSDTNSSLSFANNDDSATGDSVAWAKAAYTPGDFKNSISATINSGTYNSVVWRTIAVWIEANVAQFRILLDANQTFNVDLTNVTFEQTWERT